MSYLVGYGPRNDDRSAVDLASQLARSLPAPIVAVAVVPRGWGTPAAGGTDREFDYWAAGEGEAAVQQALADLAEHPEAESSARWVAARSVPAALVEQASVADADMIVVGSAEEAEVGRVRLTSKTDRLVHSSTLPVAIAPRGYRTNSKVQRVTVALRDDDASWSLLARVADLVRRTGSRMRVVTFIVSPSARPVTSTVSADAHTQVIDQWSAQATVALNEAEAHLRSVGFSGDELEFALQVGVDWPSAVASVPWQEGDILVLGSSSTHRLAQIFLGSSAAKILRSSPVPVVVVPGAALS